MPPILHITTAPAWRAAQHAGSYTGDTLVTEGFIHCSTPDQLLAVANARYRLTPDVLLLVIDPRLVESRIHYEDGGNGELYPHIYGPLDLSAVVDVVALPLGPDGFFHLPASAHLPTL